MFKRRTHVREAAAALLATLSVAGLLIAAIPAAATEAADMAVRLASIDDVFAPFTSEPPQSGASDDEADDDPESEDVALVEATTAVASRQREPGDAFGHPGPPANHDADSVDPPSVLDDKPDPDEGRSAPPTTVDPATVAPVPTTPTVAPVTTVVPTTTVPTTTLAPTTTIAPTTTAPAPTVPAPGYGHSSAGSSLSLAFLNQLRSTQGLPQLSSTPDLAGFAQTWVQHMVENGVYHSSVDDRPELWVEGRTLLGENIVYWGLDTTDVETAAARLHELWVGSPSHYANMVRPEFNQVGVALYHDETGWYGVHVFAAG